MDLTGVRVTSRSTTRNNLEELLFLCNPSGEPEMIWYEKRNAKLAKGEIVTLGFKDESLEDILYNPPALSMVSTRDQWTRVKLYSNGQLIVNQFADKIEFFQPVKITRIN